MKSRRTQSPRLRYWRILFLLLLISVLGGGAWLLLRESSDKKIREWREWSAFFFYEAGDLATAEELNAKIRDFLPESVYDLIFKAQLNERKGTLAGLREALATYDEILTREDPQLLLFNIFKSRILRALKRFREARGVALSVVDSYPFEATMELGHVAMAQLDPETALQHFSAALSGLEVGVLDRAQAFEATARAYLLLMALNSRPDRADSPESDLVDVWKEKARDALDQAVSALQSLPTESASWSRAALSLVRLYETRVKVKKPDETPFWEGAKAVESVVDGARRTGREIPPTLLAALGALNLQAAWYERDDIPRGAGEDSQRLVDRAELHFLEALYRSPAQARNLLNTRAVDDGADSERLYESKLVLAPQLKDRFDYIISLISIAKLYLASPDYDELVTQQPSRLALAERIEDGMNCNDSELSSVCLLIVGFANLKGGKQATADKLFRDYLASVSADARPSACLRLAAACLQLIPQSPVVFEFLDKYEELSEGTAGFSEKELRLLLRARTVDALSEEASRRMTRALERMARNADTSSEHVAVARILRTESGWGSAIGHLKRAQEQFPKSRELVLLSAQYSLEKADFEVRTNRSEEAVRDYGAALRSYGRVLIDDPTATSEVLPQVARVLTRLEDVRPGERPLFLDVDAFPTALASDVNDVSEAIRAFSLGDYSRAIELSGEPASREAFQPFLSYMRGVSYLGLASAGAAARDVSSREPQVRAAEREFQRYPECLANRLEVANLEFHRLSPQEDVPDALITEIERLAGTSEVGGLASLLHARVLAHRLQFYNRTSAKENLELGRLLRRIQSALRQAIRQRPQETGAYLALANALLLGGSSANYERAINVLKAAPLPNEEVVTSLAAYLERTGNWADAAEYRLILNLAAPARPTAESLLLNLLNTRDFETVEWLLGETDNPPGAEEPTSQVSQRLTSLMQEIDHQRSLRCAALSTFFEAAKASGSFDGARTASLGLIRSSWRKLASFEGLRHIYLADLNSRRLRAATTDGEKESCRARMITHYEGALEYFENEGVPPPFVVLNNLAWNYAEDSRAEIRARGLKLAKQARDRFRSPEELPRVFDTYAWALYRNGQLEEATREYEKLSAYGGRFRYHLARVLFDRGEYEGALREVREAMEAPNSSGEWRESARQLRDEVMALKLRAAEEPAGSVERR